MSKLEADNEQIISNESSRSLSVDILRVLDDKRNWDCDESREIIGNDHR